MSSSDNDNKGQSRNKLMGFLSARASNSSLMTRRKQGQLTLSSNSTSNDKKSANSKSRDTLQTADVFNFYNIGEHIGSGFLGSVCRVYPKTQVADKSLVIKIMSVDEEQNFLRAKNEA